MVEIPSAPAAAVGELESVEATVKKLLQTLEDVTEYVAKVTKGEMAADPAVVRLLQQLWIEEVEQSMARVTYWTHQQASTHWIQSLGD